MKNKLLISGIRKILSSRRKFISLLCLALLGVGFYGGIKATSPDMQKTLDNYLDEQHFYDIEIVSSLGLTNSDIEKIKTTGLVDEIIGSKYTDEVITINNVEKTIRIIDLTKINQVVLKEGKMPANNNEIVVEKTFLKNNKLTLGDVIEFNSQNLKDNKFKIVGVVESPLYFTSSRGTTNVGNGEINYFGYVKSEAFITDYYTNIYLTLKDTSDLITNSKVYLNKITSFEENIIPIEEEQCQIRFNELYGEKINYLKSLNIKVNMDDFPVSKWYLFDRTNNDGYKSFIDSVDSIKQLGSVFPLIFYVVAILISLISMSRMVEEERCEIGTLKGLGFSNYHIYLRNIIYSFLATTIGGIIGMLIGFNLIPKVIWNIYTSLFTIPNFVCEFNWYYGIIGLFIAILCICGSSFITTYNILREKPSQLMRPKAPKVGKKIFLENFKFWDKLSFSTKISIRNIFRYKKRIIITIIGIAGSTALMLVGFGLKDSIVDIVNFNYNNVFIYDRMIYLSSNGDPNNVIDQLEDNKEITNKVEAKYEIIDLYNHDQDSFEVNLIVPYNSNNLNEVIQLHDINNKKKEIKIKDDYAYISEKLAKLLKVKVGDKETAEKVAKNKTDN